MSYEKDVKVLCQIKAWLVVRGRGRESGRVWHQMMLGGGGGVARDSSHWFTF